MKTRPEPLIVACGLVALLFGGACAGNSGGSSGNGQPVRGGTLTIAYPLDPTTLSPVGATSSQGDFVAQNIRDRFVGLDDSDNVIPSLATSWDTPNAQTYIFHLRSGVKFSNGAPFSAADAKYTFDTVLGPSSAVSGQLSYISDAQVIDAQTVQINLKRSYPDFLDDMAFRSYLGIIPNGWMQQCGSECDSSVVGTGPFKVKEFAKGDHLTLVRNSLYWNAPFPYLDQINFRVVPDPVSEEVQLKSGKADVLTTVPLIDADALGKTQGITVYRHGSGITTELALNTATVPFNNFDVRRAIDLAIDRKPIVDGVLFGYAEIAKGLYPSWLWCYDAASPAPVYDSNQAKALLAKAGYGPSNPLSFELRVPPTGSAPQIATLIQAQLATIGVQMKILQMERAAFYGSIFRRPGTPGADYHSWQAAMPAYFNSKQVTNYSYDQVDTSSFLNTSGVNLPGGLSVPELQTVETQANTETDRTKRIALLQKESQLVQQYKLYLPIAFQDNVQAARSRVHGFKALVASEYPLRYVWVSGS